MCTRRKDCSRQSKQLTVWCVCLQVSKLPQDLLDRRVEITGPVDRKMVINALNSGASVFMADFEDSNAPTWYSLWPLQ